MTDGQSSLLVVVLERPSMGPGLYAAECGAFVADTLSSGLSVVPCSVIYLR